ncbi:MAG TPA: APC family permease [Candidatus Thermoplasmatota archaeon]|nr:APC family permease [Candidatus Thermoplasmatota archaeon]
MAELRRDLGLLEATTIVVGSMIGSGIFLGVRQIAGLVRDPWLVLGVFLAAGLLVLLGALTYGELASLFPTSGGTYAWIKEAYGPVAGYLQGWSILTIAKSASLAALGVAFATYLGALVPLGAWAAKGVALALILLLSLVNVLGVRYGGIVSNLSTFAKVGALVVLVVLGLALFGRAERVGLPDGAGGGLGLASAFGAGMVFAMFAYDGWANSAQVAEEVKDPTRNVPRSLVLGVVTVMGVYLAVAFVYLLHLGVGGVAATDFAAAAAAESFGGPLARTLLVVAVLVSVAGTANAVILSGPRVTFAMARDGLFFRKVQEIHPRFGTPATSIWLQAAWSCVLALSGTFDQLLTAVIFSSWIWYALAAYAVIVFRRRMPDAPRAVRVPLYPVVPAIFLGATAIFTVNTLVRQPFESLAGVAIVAAGLPVLWLVRRAAPTEAEAVSTGARARTPALPGPVHVHVHVHPDSEAPPAPGLRPGGTLDEEGLRARLVHAARGRHARGESWSTEEVARELDADVGAVYAALAGLAGTELEVGYSGGRLTVRPRT